MLQVPVRQRLAGLLAMWLVAAAAPPPTLAAYQASVYSNVTAFDVCDGTPDTISRTLKTLAASALSRLTYTVGSFETTGFTRAAVLGRTAADLSVYVHSHGDHYWNSSGTARVDGFREDAGRCSEAIVYANEIAARRSGPARIVVMSTCHLGEAPLDGTRSMSSSYGIEQVRTYPGTNSLPASKFYLAYTGTAFTLDQLRFERSFWAYVGQGFSLGDSFTFALRSSGISTGTHPTWFGDYAYYGWPYISLGCRACV